MANLPLQEIVFPGLSNVYKVPVVDATLTTTGAAADAKKTGDEISGLKNDFTQLEDKVEDAYNAFVVETETGSIASFTDGADDVPVKDLQVAIEPVQSGSGDPSPENIRPISGWTGLSGQNTANAQQWDEEWEVGAISVSDGSLLNSETYMRSKNYIPVASGKTYYRAGGYMSDGRAFFYEQDKSFISHTSISAVGAFDIPYNACFMKFHKNGASYSNDISINYPSTDHDYHAYNGSSVSIDWTAEAGTVYGGTLDVTTGVLTVDMYTVDLGNMTWYYATDLNYPYFRADLSAVFPNKRPADNGTHANMICTKYKTTDANTPYLGQVTNCVCAFAQNTNIAVYDTAYTDATAFKNASSGVMLCYELATPQTYQLTAQEVSTILGQNNIFADTGNVTVQYRADTKLYIDKVLSA